MQYITWLTISVCVILHIIETYNSVNWSFICIILPNRKYIGTTDIKGKLSSQCTMYTLDWRAVYRYFIVECFIARKLYFLQKALRHFLALLNIYVFPTTLTIPAKPPPCMLNCNSQLYWILSRFEIRLPLYWSEWSIPIV